MKRIDAKQSVPYLILVLVILSVFGMMFLGDKKTNTLTYSELLNELSEGKVTEIVTSERKADGYYAISGKLEGYKKNETFRVQAPLSENVLDVLSSYR